MFKFGALKSRSQFRVGAVKTLDEPMLTVLMFAQSARFRAWDLALH